jgi:hypothetical protein
VIRSQVAVCLRKATCECHGFFPASENLLSQTNKQTDGDGGSTVPKNTQDNFYHDQCSFHYTTTPKI